jgi:hypothetical protein
MKYTLRHVLAKIVGVDGMLIDDAVCSAPHYRNLHKIKLREAHNGHNKFCRD